MKLLSGMFNSWSHCILQCCQPVIYHFDEKSHDHDELDHHSFAIIRNEPSFMPRPNPVSLGNTSDTTKQERAPRKRHGSGWSSFSARNLLGQSDTDTSLPRRPRISGPSNFRHVYSESFHFPDYTSSQLQLPPASFRPLELNLNTSDTRLSPILPHFNYSSPPVTPPPRAYTTSSPSVSDSPAMSHERSLSSTSFNIPRRPVNGGPMFEPPRSHSSTPQRPPPARMRGYTSPSPPPPPIMEDLVERVANAMLERDRLQEQIDDIVERQTIYTNSRPSTAHGQPEMEPMPEVPAMPPNAPSFSERLSSDHAQGAATIPPTRTRYEANSSRKIEGRIPPPPLPLRLRPPLRKKKSFSRVSSWLFPAGAEQPKEIGLDALTNAPQPVTNDKGFYQVARPEPARRASSFDSESTVSDWTVEEQTILTSLSPSSPATPRPVASPPTSPPMGPRFGLQEAIPLRPRKGVGVAF
ncbi:hypothetical protein F5Y14DRAFT_443690 [Nemania sp. NC0429]|nr:hypothetical protein F5Y14DRAFT_443690 [Nemania sp. NC0429]